MKLKSIKKIKEYKSFKDFNWHPFLNNDNFHDDVNIFYGENGSGKSSICNILKSISENKDFGKCKPTETCLLFDDGEKNYPVNNCWDSRINKDSTLFFDREFVAKNVHEYERKTTKEGQEQQSGKLIIEFDSDAIKLRDLRDEAKKQKDEQDQKIKNHIETNKEILSLSLNIEEKKLFEKNKNKTDEETKTLKQELIKEKKEVEKNFDLDQILQKKVSAIQNNIKNIQKIHVNLFFSDYITYQGIFDFDLKEQIKISSKQELIDKIKDNKAFFDAGFEIRKIHKKQCPFCQTDNTEEEINKIISLYNQIYDTTYKIQVQKFEKNKQTLINELSQISQFLTDFDVNSIFIELKKLDQNYKIKNIYSVNDEEIHKKPTDKEIKKLIIKISKLTKPTKENIKNIYDIAKIEFNIILNYFTTINNFIYNKNTLISKFITDNTDIKLQSRIKINNIKIKTIDDELNFINTNKVFEQKKKYKIEKEQKILQDVSVKFKTKYEAVLKDYEEHCSKKAFTKLLAKIQSYFKNFNFSFKLELKNDPTGNKTEFPFAFKVLDLDDNERDFKDGLSEGEIQVLSLCFFFAFLDIQKNKKQKILIFDDPITSLDNSNLSSLVDLIAEEQKNFSQIFVFTHHKTFFKFLRKRFNTGTTKNFHGNEYNIIRNKKEFGGSFICKSKDDKFLDKLKSFETDLIKIPPTSLDMELKVVEYGQYLRYEVERYIKNTLLHWDADRDFTLAIEGVKTNKLIADDDLNKIKGIYSFCNWTTSHVDVGDDNGLGQLKDKINDFIKIVK